MRNPTFCICENKDADQRLCVRYIDSTITLLPNYKISSLKPSCVVVQPGLCGTRSETPKTGFLTTRLICVSTGAASIFCIYADNISLVVRKPIFGVSDQVRHKPGCTAIKDGQRLEISDLGSRGIALSIL